MAEVDINDLTSIGLIRDMRPYMLPPEAWNLVTKMRVAKNGQYTCQCREQAFGTPGTPPRFALQVRTASQNFILYMGLTKAFVWDGNTHTDVTRLTGDYTASSTKQINGTLFGGIAIMNNGVDIPQTWAPPAVTTDFVNMINWPGTLRAKVIRGLGAILTAYGLVDSGTRLDHTIQWSHPADPGSLPISWDHTDPTKDAGRTDLPDVNAGIIPDALPLAQNMYIYKEGSVWRQTFIGGRQVFDFKTFLDTVGMLSERCVCVSPDGQWHLVATQGDSIRHNGKTVESVFEFPEYSSLKRSLFQEIDAANFGNSFMMPHPQFNEVLFCYPTTGNTTPNKAILINLAGRRPIPTEIDGLTFENYVLTNLETESAETWEDGGDVSWDADPDPWSVALRRKTIVLSPTLNKFYLLDGSTLTKDGVVFETTLQRTGLAIVGRKRNGEWIEDHQAVKLLHRIWPKVRGTPCRIRVGSQETVDGPILWGNYIDFDPSVDVKVDPITTQGAPMSGRAIAVEFGNIVARQWGLDGYKPDLEVIGEF